MNKTLDVHTAELITAAVEVKTLTIRGKQVTLAVFRQLEERPLLLDNGTLAGIPWGRVNYHPDKCADDAPHMHVVWQEAAELRRARVATQPYFKPFHGDGLTNSFLLMGLTSESGIIEPPALAAGRLVYERGRRTEYVNFVYEDALLCTTTIDESHLPYILERQDMLEQYVEHGMTEEQVDVEMGRLARPELARQQRIRSATAMLAELSQLFIAV